jgi:hypothetical protein
MKLVVLGALGACALGSAAKAAHVQLECSGVGSKPTSEVTQAHVYGDSGASASGFATTTGIQQVAGTAAVSLAGGSGRVRVPRSIVPPIHSGDRDGWWELYDVKETETEITARFRLNPLNKPRVTINRLTGAIEMAGAFQFAFAGTCRPAQVAERLF